MSTASEWEQVLELTLVCGAVSLVWSVFTKRKASAAFLYFAEMAFFGLVLGMLMVFQCEYSGPESYPSLQRRVRDVCHWID